MKARIWAVLGLGVVLGALLLMLVQAAGAQYLGSVTVYPGVERVGLERRACGFKDGIFIMRGEIERRQIVVSDPLNREYYRSAPIAELEGYAVQQITCNRSAQTGLLVLTVGGFYAGTSGQQALTIATDYPIAEEVTYEEYQAGKR